MLRVVVPADAERRRAPHGDRTGDQIDERSADACGQKGGAHVGGHEHGGRQVPLVALTLRRFLPGIETDVAAATTVGDGRLDAGTPTDVKRAVVLRFGRDGPRELHAAEWSAKRNEVAGQLREQESALNNLWDPADLCGGVDRLSRPRPVVTFVDLERIGDHRHLDRIGDQHCLGWELGYGVEEHDRDRLGLAALRGHWCHRRW